VSKYSILFFFFINVAAFSQSNQWTWVSGSDTVNARADYGSKGAAASSNVPGARSGAVTWADQSNNLWLFGGYGLTAKYSGFLNDLWKWDGTNWTWESGNDTINSIGYYGTKGVASALNVPGAREFPSQWVDHSGNLWLFGGAGYGNNGSYGKFNDLWKWDGVNWTWVSGTNTVNSTGNYGTKGIDASSNIPGGRSESVSWTDISGNMWLFGGESPAGLMNDLWKWDGVNWTWISGANTAYSKGDYGIMGIAASSNMPGARGLSNGWSDKSGNMWLFSGNGYTDLNLGYLNDLWKWDGTNWTWMSGTNTVNSKGNYGTKGITSSSNQPAAKMATIVSVDHSGIVWIFGGFTCLPIGYCGPSNDLWKWDGTNWTWISGTQQIGNTGVYGTKGIYSSSNVPGAREYSTCWTDTSGNFCIFGGTGYGKNSSLASLNDLWAFKIPDATTPVKLIRFDLQKQKENILLSWQSATELNMKAYEIERSVDGINFDKIGTVASANNSSGTHYSFTDDQPAAGHNYYRLKCMDNDGNYFYSIINTVLFTIPENEFTIFPNPVKDMLTIQHNFNSPKLYITVTDITGRKIIQVDQPVKPEIALPLNNFQKGIYLINISDGQHSVTRKFIKE
jgi:hypothetical protein